jgi:hypothetical protein
MRRRAMPEENKLSEEGVALLHEDKCPNCKRAETMYPGPAGGMCRNLICDACGARYDATPFGIDILDEPPVTPRLFTKPLSMWRK